MRLTLDEKFALERVALRAWPAADEQWLGQWLIRANGGYSKRANSTYVMGVEPGLDLDERFNAAAAFMRTRDLPLIVRESSLVSDLRIADGLQQRGYSLIDETIVMGCSLPPLDAPEAEQTDVDTWLRLYLRFEGGTKGNQTLHRDILGRIAAPTRFGVRCDDGEPVAIGQAVAEDDWVGLFSIATDPARRRLGHGRALVEQLLSWGRKQGAKRSYLQVEARNAPALALYEKLGYAEVYRYWYWVLRA